MSKLLLLLVFLGLSLSKDSQPIDNQIVTTITIDLCEIPRFTRENLKQYLLEKEILHPEIVYAQAVLETGDFTSRIFRENHNLFGMKLAKKRRTLAIGEQYGHACYNNWQESVDDYLLWQKMWVKTPTRTEYQYYKLLDRTYAEDTTYVDIVKVVRKRNDWI